MRTAQQEYNWKLNFGEIAQIFRGGCIIRARVPAEDHRGVRARPEAREPAARSVLQ